MENAITVRDIREKYFDSRFKKDLFGEIEKIPIVVEEIERVSTRGSTRENIQNHYFRINKTTRAENDWGKDGEVALEMMLDRALYGLHMGEEYKWMDPATLLDVHLIEKLLPTYVMGVVHGSSYFWNRQRQTVYAPRRTQLHVLGFAPDREGMAGGLIYKYMKTVEEGKGEQEEILEWLRRNHETDKQTYNKLPDKSYAGGTSNLVSLLIICYKGNTLNDLHRHIRMSCG
jgi:hypothetical protein